MSHHRLLCLTVLLLAWTNPAWSFVAYVSNEKSNTVSVIDTDTWTVTATIKVGQRPRGIEFTRDGKFVMVAVGDDDTIQVIDTKTQQVVDTLPSGPDPELFTQDPSGKLLYVANENDNTGRDNRHHRHMRDHSAITATCTWSRAGRRRAYPVPTPGAKRLPVATLRPPCVHPRAGSAGEAADSSRAMSIAGP